MIIKPARVEIDPPFLTHGDIAGESNDRVGKRDFTTATGLVFGISMIVRRVAMADAIGEMLELFAISA